MHGIIEVSIWLSLISLAVWEHGWVERRTQCRYRGKQMEYMQVATWGLYSYNRRIIWNIVVHESGENLTVISEVLREMIMFETCNALIVLLYHSQTLLVLQVVTFFKSYFVSVIVGDSWDMHYFIPDSQSICARKRREFKFWHFSRTGLLSFVLVNVMTRTYRVPN